MPRNPNNPRRKFASEAERLAAEKETRRRWRARNKHKVKASIDRFHEKNPTWRKEQHLMRAYGLSYAAYVDILTLQNNSCAICGASSPGRKSRSGKEDWVVDHCHRTNRVRGIICHPCNAAIGFAKDNPKILRAIADYLEK